MLQCVCVCARVCVCVSGEETQGFHHTLKGSHDLKGKLRALVLMALRLGKTQERLRPLRATLHPVDSTPHT
jgi:hypothetical protein